jgi:hypothetical protein
VIRKITSIVFIFLASSIFIAHDVIPHHHHDDQVCFEHHSCSHNNETEKKGFPDEDTDECCLLADVKLIVTGSQKTQIICASCSRDDKSEHNFSPHFTLFNPEKLLILTPLPFRQNPCFEYFRLSHVNQIVGLRAPPIV